MPGKPVARLGEWAHQHLIATRNWRGAARGANLQVTSMSPSSHLLLAGFWGGLLSLERRAFLQAMFSRPLVAATGTGLLLEDLAAGLSVGVFFELFYLGGASLGGSHPDHETLPAVAGTALAAGLADASNGISTAAMWSIGVLLAAPLGPLGRGVENALDLRAARYLGEALDSADLGNFRRVARQNLWGMWPHFVLFGAACAVSAALGTALGPWEAALAPRALRGLAWAWPAMTAVAAAMAVRGSRSRHAVRWAAAAAGITIAAIAVWGSV